MSEKHLVWAGVSQGAVRVDDWPNAPKEVKTIAIHTHNFVGTVKLYAVLVTNPNDDDWMLVQSEVFNDFIDIYENKVRNRISNSRDRYVVMKAEVEGTGRVDRIIVI